jgi:deoxyribodipyrimidine photo-lyase
MSANTEKLIAFWHRRDLRLEDNHGLYEALKSGAKVVPVFIFDRHILDKLDEKKDARVQFIHQELKRIKGELRRFGSDILVRYGYPEEVWQNLLGEYSFEAVFTNRDYEPYARERDEKIEQILRDRDLPFETFKDHVIFEKEEIVKDDGDPYIVYTPYSRKWLDAFDDELGEPFQTENYFDSFHEFQAADFPSLSDIGFESFDFDYPEREIDTEVIKRYADRRDIPAVKGTSRLSMHLRFGTISIRKVTRMARKYSKSWLNELIWRNFYQIIIWHFPEVVEKSFRRDYDRIPWRNDPNEFEAWCEGKTGFPIVDAGMRELNSTGFMHNRVRMITASFLTKHLLIDWRWGEAYFGKKLLDYELASNNGGWQWAAGSGCDAAPYFRVFNPELQMKKFDPEMKYIKRWVPEIGTDEYPKPIVEHKMARERALETYKQALSND